MHLSTPISLKHNYSRQDHIICIVSLGTITICVGLICLNFRARLLNRTNLKDKQHRSSNRPLPIAQRSTCTAKSSSDCSLLPKHRLLCNRCPIDSTLENPSCPHCYISSNSKGKQYLDKPITFTHAGAPHNNQFLINNIFPRESPSPVKKTNENQSNKTTSTKTHRNFHLPSWVLKLLHFLTELRSSTNSDTIKSCDYDSLHASTMVSGSTASTANSGSESASLSLGPPSVPTLSRRNGSTPFTGVFYSGSRLASLELPRLEAVHQKQTSVVPDCVTFDESVLDKNIINYSQAGTFSKIPGSQTSLIDLPVTDTDSMISSSDIIDPVYSKIHNSSFGNLAPDDYDSVLSTENWNISTNWQRDSFVSYDSEESDQASAHIYHQLVKTSAPTGRYNQTAPRKPAHQQPIYSLSKASSDWSIRLIRQSPLRKVIDCVTAPRSTESDTRVYQNTPPKLPDRSYGQSTLNLVYRLRSLLHYKGTDMRRAPAPASQVHVLKAVTFSSFLNDSPYTEVTKSCTSINSAVKDYRLSHRSDGQISKGHANYPFAVPSKLVKSQQSGATSLDVFPSEPPNVHYIDPSSSSALASARYSSSEITQNNLHCARFEHENNKDFHLKGSMHGLQNVMYCSKFDGSYGNIRHIDSEVDLMDTKHFSTLGFNPSLPTRAITSNHQHRMKIPENVLHVPLVPNGTEIPTLFPKEPQSNPLHVNSFSPAKSLLSAQPRLIMSPLMERSMEDDEVRHAIKYSSRVFL